MLLPGARLFRAPIWCPPGGGGTREAGSTVVMESLVALYRVGTHQIRRGRREAQSSTSQGSAEPLCAILKGANREVSEEKLISDHGLFSFYEGQQGAVNGQDSWDFSGIHRALDGWVLARAPASPAQGLHLHGPRYSNFPYFCMMHGLEKLGLLIKTDWSVVCLLCCREH